MVVYSVNFDDVIEEGSDLGPFDKDGKYEVDQCVYID